MKFKPETDRIDRIEIKLVEYQGARYMKSKTISVYDITIEELHQKIINALKKAAEK